MTLAATVGVAVLGAYLFYRMKVPAGALIGAILFTAIFNIMTGMGTFPTAMKTVVQAIAGGFIGQRITRGDLKEMKTILGASLLMFFCMAADTFVMGFLMFRFSELDLATALVAAMPAGLSDIALISTDLGADGDPEHGPSARADTLCDYGTAADRLSGVRPARRGEK